MPTYHQMGYDSENLLTESALVNMYAGAILSPTDSLPAEAIQQISGYRKRVPNAEIIFDPQLYFPHSERYKLGYWKYFPKDFDTADMSIQTWWANLLQQLANTATDLQVDAVCSPIIVPSVYDDDYYSRMVQVADDMLDKLSTSNIAALQTVIVQLADLTKDERVLSISSIISQSQIKRIYLIINSTVAPRQEIDATEPLKGAMRLIRLLENAGIVVLVGFCSSDMVLWKAAGASHCATGKFWNLRRFSPSRWEKSKGGQPAAYWFEEALLASIKEADVLRLNKLGLLSPSSLQNPYGQTILSNFEAEKPKPWVGSGWRQFLYWFASFETRVEQDGLNIENFLREVEDTWLNLNKSGFLMEDPLNNGSWLRPWRRALNEYKE